MFYPKISYSLETQTESGTNNNVSLLDLLVENDFVLYGPYGDKSLIRNVLTYRMFEKFGHYSPRTRFVELVVNGDYQGLYVLTEKIKRDENRVDIAKITQNGVMADGHCDIHGNGDPSGDTGIDNRVIKNYCAVSKMGARRNPSARRNYTGQAKLQRLCY